MKKMIIKLILLCGFYGLGIKVISVINTIALNKISGLQLKSSNKAYALYELTNQLPTYITILFIILFIWIIKVSLTSIKDK